MLKMALQELKLRLEPYQEFWEEWIRQESCFLNKEEIACITVQRRNNFHYSFIGQWMYCQKAEFIQGISNKLKTYFYVFQEWVIFRFLCRLIALAENYDAELFFDSPIVDLKLPERLKTDLQQLRIDRVRQLVFLYTSSDLKRSWIYETILAFSRHEKQERLGLR